MSKLLDRIMSRAEFAKRFISQTIVRLAKMPNPMELATGLEKCEMQAKNAGNKDPFGIRNIIKRGSGSRDCPTLVPSAYEARLVGCLCNEERRFAQWMWLERGSPKRCECGYWFKIREVEPFGQ